MSMGTPPNILSDGDDSGVGFNCNVSVGGDTRSVSAKVEKIVE